MGLRYPMCQRAQFQLTTRSTFDTTTMGFPKRDKEAASDVKPSYSNEARTISSFWRAGAFVRKNLGILPVSWGKPDNKTHESVANYAELLCCANLKRAYGNRKCWQKSKHFNVLQTINLLFVSCISINTRTKWRSSI